MKHALKTVPPERSHERQRLAEVIGEHEALKAKLAKLRHAAERAQNDIFAASRATDKAHAELAEAKAAEEENLVADYVTGANKAPDIEAKSAAATMAEAALDRARKIRDALDGEIREFDSELRWSQDRIDQAIHAVIAADPATRELFDRHRKARETMIDAAAALNVIALGLPQEFRHWGSWPSNAVTPSEAPWRAALLALETDADAPLPDVS